MIYQLIGRLRLSILLKEKIGNLLTCKRIHNLGIWISHFCQYQHRYFKLSFFFFSASNVLQPNNVPCRNIWDVKEGCKIWDVKGPRSGVVAVRRYPTSKVRSSGCALLDRPRGETPHPRAKEKPQQDSRRGKFTFRIKPHSHQRRSKGSNKPWTHQDPETPRRLSQNCVWGSPVEVQGGSDLPQGQGLWVQQSWVWHNPFWRRSPLTPP